MAELKCVIPDELDKAFRMEIGRRMGIRKGAISKAMEEAIRRWLENEPMKPNKTKLRNHSSDALRERVLTEYSGQYVVIKDEEIVAANESIVEATRQAQKARPEVKKFVLIHAVHKSRTEKRLGMRAWRVRE